MTRPPVDVPGDPPGTDQPGRRPRHVVLVDDDPRFVGALADLLGDHDDLTVLAAVVSADQALDVVTGADVDVVVVDVQMPGDGGAGLTRRLLEHDPGLVVLALSAAADPRSRAAMLAAGARAYFVKSPPCDDVVTAVRTVPVRTTAT
ncbi:response regulator [Thalassiella azotivora]